VARSAPALRATLLGLLAVIIAGGGYAVARYFRRGNKPQ
jgi:hypothetical protein